MHFKVLKNPLQCDICVVSALTWDLAEERVDLQRAGAVDGAPPEVGGRVDGDALRRRRGAARRLVPVALGRL